jgi:hypothetical protein
LQRIAPDVIGFCAKEIQAFATKMGETSARAEVLRQLEHATDPEANIRRTYRKSNMYDREAEFLNDLSNLPRPGTVGGPERAGLNACISGRVLALLGPSVGSVFVVRKPDGDRPEMTVWENGERRRLQFLDIPKQLVRVESDEVHDLEVTTATGTFRCSIFVAPGGMKIWDLASGCPKP